METLASQALPDDALLALVTTELRSVPAARQAAILDQLSSSSAPPAPPTGAPPPTAPPTPTAPASTPPSPRQDSDLQRLRRLTEELEEDEDVDAPAASSDANSATASGGSSSFTRASVTLESLLHPALTWLLPAVLVAWYSQYVKVRAASALLLELFLSSSDARVGTPLTPKTLYHLMRALSKLREGEDIHDSKKHHLERFGITELLSGVQQRLPKDARFASIPRHLRPLILRIDAGIQDKEWDQLQRRLTVSTNIFANEERNFYGEAKNMFVNGLVRRLRSCIAWKLGSFARRVVGCVDGECITISCIKP